MAMIDTLKREQLAALAHEQWSGWMKHLFGKSICDGPFGCLIPGDLADRWLRQLNTPYADLSEEEKESDRKEADRVLAVIHDAEPVDATLLSTMSAYQWAKAFSRSTGFAPWTAAVLWFSNAIMAGFDEAERRQAREICICAAIELADGRIIRGHRHDDCLNTALKWADAGQVIEVKAQGFVTSRNRFVTRRQAIELQRAAGIKSRQSADGSLVGSALYSEDLY
jgi:hypothetical protein